MCIKLVIDTSLNVLVVSSEQKCYAEDEGSKLIREVPNCYISTWCHSALSVTTHNLQATLSLYTRYKRICTCHYFRTDDLTKQIQYNKISLTLARDTRCSTSFDSQMWSFSVTNQKHFCHTKISPYYQPRSRRRWLVAWFTPVIY